MKLKIAVASLALILAGNAHAGCKQADAKGTWITYQAAFIAEGPHVGQCKLEVDKAGNVNSQSSSCEFVTFDSGPIATDGTVTVEKDCSAAIKLGLGSFSGQVQIARNKQTYAGRFSAQDGTVSGTTTGVKQ